MTPITIHLTYVRSTKGMCRYIEGALVMDEETQTAKEVLVKAPLVGVLYLSKERLGAKPPKSIVVTITGGEDAKD